MTVENIIDRIRTIDAVTIDLAAGSMTPDTVKAISDILAEYRDFLMHVEIKSNQVAHIWDPYE